MDKPAPRNELIPGDRRMTRPQSADSEEGDSFYAELPQELQALFADLIAQLEGGGPESLGPNWTLFKIQSEIQAKISDSFDKAELLRTVALMEPFVHLHEAHSMQSRIERSIQQGYMTDPTS